MLDLAGATTRHDLQSVASLFNLPATALAGQTVTEAVEQEEHQAAAQGQIAVSGRLVARAVELFKQRRFQWVPVGPRFILSLGGGNQLVLEPRADGWAVLDRRRGESRARVMATGLPLDYAQGAAEDQARLRGVEHLVDREAPWRQRPASEKQLATLRRWRMPVFPGLTAGEASDQISAAVLRRSA